jgi:integrase
MSTKKPKRRWVGRIYLGRDDDGRQQFIWLGRFATRRERDDAVAKRRAQLLLGERPQLPNCDTYVDRYLTEYERLHKGSSHGTQADRLKRFRDDFAGQSLDISRQDAKDWVHGEGKWAARGPVPASCVHPVVTLYNHAINEDDLPVVRNPFRNLGARTKGRAEQPPPTEAEFQKILDSCAVLGGYADRMRAFVKFVTFELMRPGEAFELEWADIDFDAMRVRKARRLYRGVVDEPKTGPKVIALTPPARDAIIGLPREGRLVFTTKTGKRFSATNMHTYWHLVTARAGVDYDLYHATKHFGVWLHVDEAGDVGAGYRGAGGLERVGGAEAPEGLRAFRCGRAGGGRPGVRGSLERFASSCRTRERKRQDERDRAQMGDPQPARAPPRTRDVRCADAAVRALQGRRGGGTSRTTPGAVDRAEKAEADADAAATSTGASTRRTCASGLRHRRPGAISASSVSERWDIQVFGVDPETRAGLGELRFSVSDHGKSATVYVDIPPDPRLAGAVGVLTLWLNFAPPEVRAIVPGSNGKTLEELTRDAFGGQ